MRLEFDSFAKGQYKKAYDQRIKQVERAVVMTVRAVTFGMQKDLKKAIVKAKFGRGLSGAKFENIVGAHTIPKKGYTVHIEGRVFSKARYTRKSGLIDLFEVFSRGATVTAGSGRWLAIPTKNAPLRSGRGGVRRAWPSETSFKLRFVPTGRPNLAMLVAQSDKGKPPTPIWWLIKSAKIAKRFPADQIVATWHDRLPKRLQSNMNRAARRLGYQI